MEKLKPFLFGALVGAGLAICALQFHVVHSHEGFRVVARTPQPSLGLSYVDVRGWDAKTWAERPALVRALVANGSGELIADTVAENLTSPIDTGSDTLDQLRGLLDNADSELSNRNREQPQPLERDWNKESADDFLGSPFTDDAPPFPSAARDNTRRTRVAARSLNSIDDGSADRSSSLGSAFTRETEDTTSQTVPRDEYSGTGYNPTDTSTDSAEGINLGPDDFGSADNSSNRYTGNGYETDSRTDSSGPNHTSDTSTGTTYGAGASTDNSESAYSSHRPALGSVSNSRDDDRKLFSNDETGEQYGVFEDVTDELETRAERALSRARRSLGSSEFLSEAGPYLRSAEDDTPTGTTMKNSLNDAPAFSRSTGGTSRSRIDRYMPEFLKAIEEGFDPFANGDIE